jgi:hypothetical protein
MSDLYGVLGLTPRASDGEIKAAYRDLAKRLHPDVNAAADAEQRFTDINRAYEVLGDRAARAAYDRGVARRRWARRGRWGPVAAGVTSFTVTSAIVVAGMFWRQPSPEAGAQSALAPATVREDVARAMVTASQRTVAPKEGQEAIAAPVPPPVPAQVPPAAEAALDDPAEDAALTKAPADAPVEQPAEEPPIQVAGHDPSPGPAASPPEGAGAAGWATYRDVRYGFKLSYPADVFAATTDAGQHARTVVSRDGRARLRIAAAENTGGTTLTDFRQTLMTGYAGANVHYAPKGTYWFVLSGTQGAEIFYRRVTLSCDRKALHTWEVVFPAVERPAFEPIIDAMHRTYRHRNGPGARCGEPKRERGQPPIAANPNPAPPRPTGRD